MNSSKRFSIEQGELLVAMVVVFPLIFWNAIEHLFPMGYAGLFTQMAEQIANLNFRLPLESPYYGPGGIPFAYPPFGLYVLAVFIKLTGKYYIFLRWLPPLFSLISIALTYLLAVKLFKSRVPAAFVAIIASASPDLYIAHTWSSGVVRAPAFIFAILTIYFFSENLENRSVKNILLTGLFFGLAALSHLAYALFCAAWIAFFSIASRDWLTRVRDSVLSGFVGLLAASVWVVPVASRHGWEVFLGAFNSHGGENIFSLLANPGGLLRLFQINFSPITSNLVLAVLFLLGAYCLFRRKRYDFILFFAVIVLVFPENARFVFWLGSFFAGCGLWFAGDWAYRMALKKRDVSYSLGLLAFSMSILAFIWWTGFKTISAFSPLLNESALELGERASDLIPPDSTYLALLIQDESEWMPFLLKRNPLTAQWGSEWLGEYNQQTRLMSLFQGCRKEKDWACVQSVLGGMDEAPQFVITYRIERALNDQIPADGQWREVFSNNRYIVWKAAGSP
ncbi:MAG: hypothetical protein C4557_03120 [Anaerolineaceae bacterium]|jgi:4-amino-4-deoxy-L-arabinose transferase-like glycosyltransferase|nr:MAG: hypothetical protein C4557_03120 [Anaerolineaceae bacterium]